MPPCGVWFDPRRNKYTIARGVEAKDQTRLAWTDGVMGGVHGRPRKLTTVVRKDPYLMNHVDCVIQHAMHEDI